VPPSIAEETAVHVWPAVHGAHEAPAEPHCWFDRPVKHCAFSSQQPAQLSALQRTTGGRMPQAGVRLRTPPISAPSRSAFPIGPDSFMYGVSLYEERR
jgi:hypothetical protein